MSHVNPQTTREMPAGCTPAQMGRKPSGNAFAVTTSLGVWVPSRSETRFSRMVVVGSASPRTSGNTRITILQQVENLGVAGVRVRRHPPFQNQRDSQNTQENRNGVGTASLDILEGIFSLVHEPRTA